MFWAQYKDEQWGRPLDRNIYIYLSYLKARLNNLRNTLIYLEPPFWPASLALSLPGSNEPPEAWPSFLPASLAFALPVSKEPLSLIFLRGNILSLIFGPTISVNIYPSTDPHDNQPVGEVSGVGIVCLQERVVDYFRSWYWLINYLMGSPKVHCVDPVCFWDWGGLFLIILKIHQSMHTGVNKAVSFWSLSF